MSTDNTKTVPAVENAARILRYLAQNGRPDGAAGTARATGLSVSSTFNILKTLLNEGLVSFDPISKTYSIGMGLLGMVGPLIGKNPTDLIQPAMGELANEHGTMIALWQITESERVVLQSSTVLDSIIHVSMPRYARLPAYVGAIGPCYVAARNMDENAARTKFASIRWQDSPGFEKYWSEVGAYREQGYAFDEGHLYKGMHVIGSICCDADGIPRIGLTSNNITGQIDSAEMHNIGSKLKNLCIKIETNIFGAKPS